MKRTKKEQRHRIKLRIRKTIKGTEVRPRLSIFRSNREIYGQIINDLDGTTIASASSRDMGLSGNKSEQAKTAGKSLGEKAKEAGIETVVFDRSGYLYHGRVKAFADGAREAGLNF